MDYQKTPANEIGSYEAPEIAKEYSEINTAFTPAEVPTSENSKRKTDSSQLDASQESPANVGNSSC